MVRPALKAAVQTCVLKPNQVVWKGQGPTFGTTLVELKVRSVRILGPDEDRSTYDGPSELIVPTIVSRYTFEFEVWVDATSQADEDFALATLTRIRKRLEWDAATALLKAAGIAIIESGTTIAAPFKDDRIWSRNMLPFSVNYTECEVADNETQWVETATATGTITP